MGIRPRDEEGRGRAWEDRQHTFRGWDCLLSLTGSTEGVMNSASL